MFFRPTLGKPAIAPPLRRRHRLLGVLLPISLSIGGGWLPHLWNPPRAQSAEKIRLLVEGPLTLSISVEALERFAETGELTGDLNLLMSSFDEATRDLIRQGLQRRFPIDPVSIAHLTRSPLGQDVLEQVGKVIQIPHQINGFYGLRGAVVAAAIKAPPQGWTILDVMREFPNPIMVVDARELLALRRELTVYFQYNQAAVEAIQIEATRAASAESIVEVSSVADPLRLGSYQFSQATLSVGNPALRATQTGLSVNYEFSVDVYLPEGLEQPAPIVIISHGFGALKDNFNLIAQHLASHGFVAIVPDHVGSDLAFRQSFLQGRLNTILSPIEYINRPQEISFLIDELERLAANDPTWATRLNLDRIGVYGDSLGGATVLSLAGAELNFTRLNRQCHPDSLLLNASLYVQCRARFLPPTRYRLHDPRIKAAIAAHPLSSGLFSPQDLARIEIPMLIAAGSNDVVAPVVTEQIHPFIWLGSPQKYLALLTPGTHWSTKPASAEGADAFPSFLIGEHQDIGSRYFKVLATSFFAAHLSDRAEYLPYLSSAYARSLSEGQPMSVDIIQSLTPEQLSAAYGKTPPIPVVPAPIAATSVPPRREEILAEIQRTGTLKIALRRDAPPFGYYDRQQQWSGYCHDWAIAFAEHLTQVLDRELAVELVQFPSSLSDRFELVRNGSVHLECGPNTIRQGIEGAVFSEPIFVTGIRFLVANDRQTPFNPFRLNGIKVGVLRNTTSEILLRDRYPEAEAVFFDGPTGHEDAVQAIVRGDLSALMGDSILAIAELQQQEVSLSDYTSIPQNPLSCEFYGLILPEGDRAWQETVNEFIESPSANRVWNAWFNQESEVVLHELDTCLNRRGAEVE